MRHELAGDIEAMNAAMSSGIAEVAELALDVRLDLRLRLPGGGRRWRGQRADDLQVACVTSAPLRQHLLSNRRQPIADAWELPFNL